MKEDFSNRIPQNCQVWIGLAGVFPISSNSQNFGIGAYVNILALVNDEEHFRELSRTACVARGFSIFELEDIQLLSDRLQENEVDAKIVELSNNLLKSGDVEFSTFHWFE